MQCPEGPYPEPSLASYTSASVRPLSAEAPQAGRKDREGNREQCQRPSGVSPLPQAESHHLS